MEKIPALFVGVDSGPHESLLPVADASGMKVETVFFDDVDSWRRRISETGTAMVVVGTSESSKGRASELAVRRAARYAGLPVAVIEDYPGNYFDGPGAEADLLVVESDAGSDLARRRLGRRCPRLTSVSPARFDALRREHQALRQRVRERWAVGLNAGESASLAWIGQPETEDCLATLKVVLPLLLGNGFRLLFRAHPCDMGYASGAYQDIARSLGVLFFDATHMDSDEVFALAPRLAITQYSSMIVQAGFYGIPSVCLLFSEAGGKQLEAKKSCRVPLPCLGGAFGVCTDPSTTMAALQTLIDDEPIRRRLISGFDAYFEADATTAQKTVAALKALL